MHTDATLNEGALKKYQKTRRKIQKYKQTK